MNGEVSIKLTPLSASDQERLFLDRPTIRNGSIKESDIIHLWERWMTQSRPGEFLEIPKPVKLPASVTCRGRRI